MSKALRKVLLADDDAETRHIVRLVLGATEGLIVRTAESGDRALELARAIRPDLMLLDVMMPGIDGPEALSRMRVDCVLSRTPVVFLTAKASPMDVKRYSAMGAAGVIAKPFDPEQLAAQLLTLWARIAPLEQLS